MLSKNILHCTPQRSIPLLNNKNLINDMETKEKEVQQLKARKNSTQIEEKWIQFTSDEKLWRENVTSGTRRVLKCVCTIQSSIYSNFIYLLRLDSTSTTESVHRTKRLWWEKSCVPSSWKAKQRKGEKKSIQTTPYWIKVAHFIFIISLIQNDDEALMHTVVESPHTKPALRFPLSLWCLFSFSLSPHTNR